LRAYRSLGEFKDEAARTGLKLALDRYSFADDGTDLLYLIAAAEAFGAIATDQDAGALGRMLNSSSRDLRVVVASALGRVASTEACNLLRARRRVEQVDQVRIAIDEAAASCVQ
jgi:HEAT repeat protein